jgi:hypothetical protein
MPPPIAVLNLFCASLQGTCCTSSAAPVCFWNAAFSSVM